jgi:hypothetical protein
MTESPSHGLGQTEISETTTRHVTRIIVLPLLEGTTVFPTAEGAVRFLDGRTTSEGGGDFGTYEVRMEFSNGDKIEATYDSKARVKGFIEFFAK